MSEKQRRIEDIRLVRLARVVPFSFPFWGVQWSDDREPIMVAEGWIADDGWHEAEPFQGNRREAAAQYVEDGDFRLVDGEATTWIHVRTWRRGAVLLDGGPHDGYDETQVDIETVVVPVHPVAPYCDPDTRAHEWGPRSEKDTTAE